MTLHFEPLPALRKTKTPWHDVAEQLKERPGEWAVVKVYTSRSQASTDAKRLRDGAFKPFRPAGTFDAWARVVDGEFRVYARFIAETDGTQDGAS